MDLSTSYLGLALRNPLVASASPLSNTVDGVRRLADAGVGAVVAGPGCSFCGDWLAWPPTRTTVATMTMNAATMAAPIIVRPPSVLNQGVVPGLGSVSVWSVCVISC